MVIWVKKFQTDIYSKRLVAAIGKVFLMKYEPEHQSKPIKVMQNGLCLQANSCFGGLHQ